MVRRCEASPATTTTKKTGDMLNGDAWVCGRTTMQLHFADSEPFVSRSNKLEGGGHINGGFLEAGLVDALSLLVVPAIDGRHDISTVFDGVMRATPEAVRLELKSVAQRAGGVLWLRYDVSKSPS